VVSRRILPPGIMQLILAYLIVKPLTYFELGFFMFEKGE